MHQGNSCSEHNADFSASSLYLHLFTFSNYLHTSFCSCTQPLPRRSKNFVFELKGELIFNSSLSKKLVQWNQTDDCCCWHGVECEGVGHVIGLQLDYEAISGGIWSSSSLFHLRYLKKLNLAYNNFNHAKIPRGIGNLTYLTHVNLSYAFFGGQVPFELSLLTRLVSLDISNSFYPSQDHRAIISNWAVQKYECVIPNGFLCYSMILDMSESSSYSEESIIWRFSAQPLKLEYPDLKMLLQNLTRLRELYLDSVDISSQGSEWCHIISSSLPDLRNLSLRNCNLSGHLDPSLLQHHSLSILQLDWNNMSTTVLDFLSNFSSLTTLSLKNCSLRGSFPGAIFQVPTLEKLDLSFNELLNELTPPMLFNLTKLVHLDLSNNMFTGLFPLFYRSKNLRYIDLSRNNLKGSLSYMHFEGLSHLVFLNVGHNLLSGSIPQSLFGLTSLEKLGLTNNQFNGRFQLEKIQMLDNLLQIILSNNNLSVDVSGLNTSFSAFPKLRVLGLSSCNLHSFPDLRNQSNLWFLDLSNNKIAGEIPNWIWDIDFYYLDLSHNFLSDLQKPYNIPASLHILDLQSNLLQSQFRLLVPTDIKNRTPSLSYFSVANNNLRGPIPRSLCSCRDLYFLDLSSNSLNGNLPQCLFESKEGLRVFNLRRNNITGDIPDRFPTNCNLETLDLSSNRLQGSIPKSLGKCTSLVAINVAHNKIDGRFPCMLPSSLRILILRSNKFHGELTCLKSWPNLQIIDIAENNFSGYLYPISFSSWKGMMLDSQAQLMVHYMNSGSGTLGFGIELRYLNEVTLIIKGQERELVKILGDFASIDFSCNNFQGTIPSSIGDLSSVDYLNLSHNALTGTIPKSLGKLRQLGSLDVSVNQLTGTIPDELAFLTFLAILNVSHNQLVGKIPTGPQIQTFSKDCFEANPRLCGLPLDISCSNTDENGSSPPKWEMVQPLVEKEIEWAYVFATLGYTVGLGSSVLVLLFCQSLRQNFFEKVDATFEKIFHREVPKRRHERRRALRDQMRRGGR